MVSINSKLILLFNKVLKSNQSSLLLLQKYHGKSFKIKYSLLSFCAVIGNDGFLLNSDNADTTITIYSSIIIPLINRNKLDLAKYLTITKNKPFALELLRIFSSLQIVGSFYETESFPTLIAIKPLLNLASQTKSSILLIADNIINSINEYLTYEMEVMAHTHEIKAFCDEVDKLNERTELLTHRLNLFDS